MVAGVVAGVVDAGLFRRDAIEAECGIGHFGGVFQSIPPSLPPSLSHSLGSLLFALARPDKSNVCEVITVQSTVQSTMYVTITTTMVTDVFIDCATATDQICSLATTTTMTTTSATGYAYRR
jgi:hypothetical protein